MAPSTLSLMPRIPIGIFTCKKNISLLILFSGLLISCRFDLKPTGAYTGTYNSSSLPVSSGTGTLAIVEVGQNIYDITFSSAGNPDIFFYNRVIIKNSMVHGYALFEIQDSEDLYISIDEQSTHNGSWYINLFTDWGTLNFKGNR